jgi:hypothetical protein
LAAGTGHDAVAGIGVITRPGSGAGASPSTLVSVVDVGAGPTRIIAATDIASSKIMNARVASST